MNNSAFISYRRDVSSFIARAIFQDLRAHSIDAFMDIESIDSGHFDSVILNQIAARPYFLLVLTPGTLDRCQESGDWLLREINQALTLGRNIIPLITPHFDFADARKYLPDPLSSELPRFNAVNVPHDYFDAAMDRLRTRFLKPVDLLVQAVSAEDASVVQRKVDQLSTTPPVTREQLTAQDYFEKGLARPGRSLNEKIADYSEAIRLNPHDANIYSRRATAYMYKGDFATALADFNTAIQLNPTDDVLYQNRAIARKDSGDIDGALADYGEAIRLNPVNSKPYYKRGSLSYHKGDYSSAIADWTKELRIDPQAASYNNRGEAYFATGEFAKARLDFQKAIDLDASSQMAHAGLAVTYYRLGQVQTAFDIWQALVGQDRRFLDAKWVGQELNWAPPLIDAASELIGELQL